MPFPAKTVFKSPIKLHISHKMTIFCLVSLMISLAGYFTVGYFISPPPTIILQTPADGQKVVGDKLYVKGTVSPAVSSVRVNGQLVAKNGDGSFTGIVSIVEGRSVLLVEADYRGRKSSVSQLVDRDFTPEELAALEEKKKLSEIKAREEVLGVDQQVDELLSVYDSLVAPRSVKILSHDLKQVSGLKKVTGEIINGVPEDVYWVKIVATFYDKNNTQIDSKVGFAAIYDKPLAPNEVAKFETQSTGKEFDYYKLTVDWKTASNVGGTTQPESSPIATPTTKRTI